MRLNAHRARLSAFLAAMAASVGLLAGPAGAAPFLLVDAASGEVLDQRDATQPWFPASTTKLMTLYVALDAVAAGRMSVDTPMVVSPRAARMAPSKMGFAPGTQVTLINALKMLMVQSANDIAVTIAEGVSGSVEAFADEMNAAAAKIGMRESRFHNPNGLPDARQVSSARDLAVLARALLQRFPEHADLYDIGAMRLGARIYPTHNGLLGRYPGADGMKTGFTCAAGFNVVASATRGGRRLIAVVLGAPSATARTMKAVSLFDRGFSGRAEPNGQIGALGSMGIGAAPDMRDGVCRNRGPAVAQYVAQIEETAIPLRGDTSQTLNNQPERSFLAFGAASAPQQAMGAGAVAALPRPVFTPVDVYVGPAPGWTGPVAHAVDYAGPSQTPATADAADKMDGAGATEDAPAAKRGRRAKVAHAGAGASAKRDEAAKPDADGAEAKPARKAAKTAAIAGPKSQLKADRPALKAKAAKPSPKAKRAAPHDEPTGAD